jgi:hypothetical protein
VAIEIRTQTDDLPSKKTSQSERPDGQSSARKD